MSDDEIINLAFKHGVEHWRHYAYVDGVRDREIRTQGQECAIKFARAVLAAELEHYVAKPFYNSIEKQLDDALAENRELRKGVSEDE